MKPFSNYKTHQYEDSFDLKKKLKPLLPTAERDNENSDKPQAAHPLDA